MKVKKVAVTAAVCAALMGSQASFAEEQPFAAEGMGFAFDDAQGSSVEMSELSGSEMEKTKGALTMSNGGNWGNTFTQTGIGAMPGVYTGSPAAAGAGAGAGFAGSFSYDWSTPGFQVNPGSSAWTGSNTGSWDNGTFNPN
jgi:hypothetical protein